MNPRAETVHGTTTTCDPFSETYLADREEFLVRIIDDEIVAMGALLRGSDMVAEIKRMWVDARYQR
ncbi:MAG: GNAT family N-acetyltransferase [Solirubrobacterales bacterium]|nr:GNAT family N-acetyltransferase [Solirubrobacterales bacterium]